MATLYFPALLVAIFPELTAAPSWSRHSEPELCEGGWAKEFDIHHPTGLRHPPCWTYQVMCVPSPLVDDSSLFAHRFRPNSD